MILSRSHSNYPVALLGLLIQPLVKVGLVDMRGTMGKYAFNSAFNNEFRMVVGGGDQGATAFTIRIKGVVSQDLIGG